MANRGAHGRIKDYFDSLSDTRIRFSPYAVLKTGLISSQTILKIEDYMLICSPYQLSMKQAILLLILSQEETHFFQQYRGDSCSLSLTFLKPGSREPLTFDVKSQIDRIGPVKNRPNLCMIDLNFQQSPPRLIEILGDYLLAYSALKSYYETFSGREIIIDDHMARMLRFNNYMECNFGRNKVRAKLVALSVNKLVFDIPADTPDVIEGCSFSCKLYFQLYQCVASGSVDEIEGYRAGTLRVHAGIGFTPELIEIMDDYFYRLTHAVADGIAEPIHQVI
jgi:hypothetical protein